MANNNQTVISILAHVLGIFGSITGIVGGLIILLASQDATVKKHAKTVLNWQFSALIYAVISMILMIILVGFVLLFVLAVLNIIFCIMGAVKASHGEVWKYPLSIPFFKV